MSSNLGKLWIPWNLFEFILLARTRIYWGNLQRLHSYPPIGSLKADSKRITIFSFLTTNECVKSFRGKGWQSLLVYRLAGEYWRPCGQQIEVCRSCVSKCSFDVIRRLSIEHMFLNKAQGLLKHVMMSDFLSVVRLIAKPCQKMRLAKLPRCTWRLGRCFWLVARPHTATSTRTTTIPHHYTSLRFNASTPHQLTYHIYISSIIFASCDQFNKGPKESQTKSCIAQNN